MIDLAATGPTSRCFRRRNPAVLFLPSATGRLKEAEHSDKMLREVWEEELKNCGTDPEKPAGNAPAGADFAAKYIWETIADDLHRKGII